MKLVVKQEINKGGRPWSKGLSIKSPLKRSREQLNHITHFFNLVLSLIKLKKYNFGKLSQLLN